MINSWLDVAIGNTIAHTVGANAFLFTRKRLRLDYYGSDCKANYMARFVVFPPR